MPVSRLTRIAAAVCAAASAVWLWAEYVDRRASSRRLGAPAPISTTASRRPPTGGPAVGSPRTDVVVVLGFRNRGERANIVNRFRVRAGIRSLDPTTAQQLLVLCGGAVGGEITEAEVMQRYARDVLGFAGPIALDPDSRSTWQNIANALPHLEDADTIKIVSNAPHAELGREILWRQRPDLASRLVRGGEHRFGEAPLLKILGALRALQSRLSGAWRTASEPRR
ncbi:YdcF family protein [Microbacterium sp. Mu-80]|uniref:YdcF family protein n=1 Tax=Microbacterium bandirmense TaxID=3122050 RepID=A0ABU8L7N2_9MICO